MKKSVFTLVLAAFILTCYNVDAQRRYLRRTESKFGLGVKAGVNYASQSTTSPLSSFDVQNILRVNGGVYANFFFLDHFAVQSELLFSGKGLQWKDPYYDAKDLLSYIDLPVLIKYQPIKYLNIHAGPQIGYRLAATQKNLDNGQKTNILDYYKPIDLGLVFGVEANLPFRINLTVRYVMGLNTVYTGTENNEQWKNNFIQVSAGYRILGR